MSAAVFMGVRQEEDDFFKSLTLRKQILCDLKKS